MRKGKKITEKELGSQVYKKTQSKVKNTKN